jgi:hypothetical protein
MKGNEMKLCIEMGFGCIQCITSNLTFRLTNGNLNINWSGGFLSEKDRARNYETLPHSTAKDRRDDI